MVKGLERLVSGVKKVSGVAGTAASVAGVLALLSFSGPKKADAMDYYKYFTEGYPIAHSGLDTNPKSGFYFHQRMCVKGDVPINSIGSHSRKEELPSREDRSNDFMSININIGVNEDSRGHYNLNFSYQRKKTPLEEGVFNPVEAYEEFLGATDIYLVIPQGVKITKLKQKVVGVSNQTKRGVELITVPYQNPKVEELIRVINNAFSVGDVAAARKGIESINELDAFTQNVLRGLLPKGLDSLTVEGYKKLRDFVRMHETARVNELEEIFDGHQVIKVPFYRVPEGRAKTTVFGREMEFELETDGLSSPSRAYLIPTSIGYKNKTHTSTIGGLVYEFDIKPLVSKPDDSR